jgi:hypothetical protein
MVNIAELKTYLDKYCFPQEPCSHLLITRHDISSVLSQNKQDLPTHEIDEVIKRLGVKLQDQKWEIIIQEINQFIAEKDLT